MHRRNAKVYTEFAIFLYFRIFKFILIWKAWSFMQSDSCHSKNHCYFIAVSTILERYLFIFSSLVLLWKVKQVAISFPFRLFHVDFKALQWETWGSVESSRLHFDNSQLKYDTDTDRLSSFVMHLPFPKLLPITESHLVFCFVWWSGISWIFFKLMNFF